MWVFPLSKTWETKSYGQINIYCLVVSLILAGLPPSVLQAQGTYYKFPVTEEGVYKITASQANQLGANSISDLSILGTSGMLSQQLDSSSFELKEIPVKEINGDLFFYLTAASTIETENGEIYQQPHHYTDTLYYLIQAHKNPTSFVTKPTEQEAVDTPTEILYKLFSHATEEYNLLSSGRKWYGKRFFGGESLTLNFAENIRFGLPFYFKGKFLAQSLTESQATVSVYQNLVQSTIIPPISANTYSITGNEAQMEGYVDPPDNDRLQINLHYHSSDRNGLGYLDYFIVGFPFPTTSLPNSTYYNLSDGAFKLTASSSQMVWDTSEFYEVKDISSPNPIFSDAEKIVLFEPREVPQITEWFDVNMDLRTQPRFAELIIITHEQLKPEAERLAAYKNETGISAHVLTTRQIYDSFGYGNSDITAIRNFVAFQYHEGGKLENVLLFGKGTFDYKNKLGGRPNLVPTYSSYNSLNPLTTFSSDDYFGFLNFGEGEWAEAVEGDHLLSIGVGRIPAINIAEAKVVVDKIIRYQTPDETWPDWKRNILFIADDGDNNVHLNDSESLATYLTDHHPEFVLNKLYLDDFEQINTDLGQRSPEARSFFESLLDSSFLLINYIGHGNETNLMAEGFFTVSDLADWPENPRLPVFVTATCEFGRHDSPLIRSGAEELLVATRKGAIALLTTGRPVFSNINFALNQAFIQEALKMEDGRYLTLGEIFKRTKNNSLNGPLNRSFSLLGDPSMRLSAPGLAMENSGYVDMDLQLEIDTLRGMQHVSYRGKVMDPLTKALIGSFNGPFEIVLTDKPIVRKTLGDENAPALYTDENIILYRGRGDVKNGIFEGEIFVPKNLNPVFGSGGFKLLAKDNDSLEEAFGSGKLIIGGIRDEALEDDQGPVIQLFAEDMMGSPLTVSPSSTIRLTALLEDPSGINISNYSDDQSITLIINEGLKLVLNDHYVAEDGTFTKGRLSLPVSNLKEGTNLLTLEAYDNLGNRSSKSIEVQVKGSKGIQITSNITYPNPASFESRFLLSHNREGENLLLQIRIFSLTGKEIFHMSERFPKANPLLGDISWIFMHSKTKIPAKGTYLYVLELQSEEDGSTDRKSGKIIIQ